MSLNQVFDISGSALTAQTVRMNTISSNLANAESVANTAEDTYKAQYPIFSAIRHQAEQGYFENSMIPGAGVQINGIYESTVDPIKRYEPNHPLADEDGYLHMPDINMIEQMADMIAASRAYQTNVDVMQTTKDMMQRIISLGQ